MNKVKGVIAGTALALTAALMSAGPAAASGIEEGPCTSGTNNWVRIRPQVHADQCYGFTGSLPVYEWVKFIHTGNNYGWWEDGANHWLPFSSCTSITPVNGPTFFVTAIEIDGWDSSGCTNNTP